ncbi:hypothetical protein CQA53_11695, partial [Helicobacter didelphidarum]
KQWDSEYKEYERLCKENIGKVVYARPITQDERERMKKMTEKYPSGTLVFETIPIGKSIYEKRYTIISEKNIRHTEDIDRDTFIYKQGFEDSVVYQTIAGYIYDRHWTEFIFFTKGASTIRKYITRDTGQHHYNTIEAALHNTQNIGVKNNMKFTNRIIRKFR